MVVARSPALAALFAALLVAPLVAPALLPRSQHLRPRRQLADDDALQPLEEASAADGEQAREKRKLEGITQAKFGIKNAVLGFVFGKINSLIDAKTRLVDTLDHKNIELNKEYGIEAPSPGGLASLTGVIGQSRGTTSPGRRSPPAPATAPATSTATGSGRSRSAPSSPSSRTVRRPRQAAQDVPTFDRNKVSLDFPGNLFGPSVSLLIKTTKIIGDVIQNSAVRYQTFLRLFRPLFRGQFEIKGLDPPTTAPPPTTTTTPRPPPPEDNEVRRRRHAARALH